MRAVLLATIIGTLAISIQNARAWGPDREECYGPNKYRNVGAVCICPPGTTKDNEHRLGNFCSSSDPSCFHTYSINCVSPSGSLNTSSQHSGSKPDAPARPNDPAQCISSRRSPMRNGYIDWKLTNNCDVKITFDYDDCDMNENLQAACKVKTDFVPARSYHSGSNYHQPANARNYR
jgi:hypothetical protein